MTTGTSITSRFRELRERAGLTIEEAAKRMGVSPWHIETDDAELTRCYSPSDARKFCRVLDARPAELFGIETAESPISAEELVRLIHEQYRSRGIAFAISCRFDYGFCAPAPLLSAVVGEPSVCIAQL